MKKELIEVLVALIVITVIAIVVPYLGGAFILLDWKWVLNVTPEIRTMYIGTAIIFWIVALYLTAQILKEDK